MTNRSIVIIGAGHSGGRAAEGLRRAGHRGPIVLIGSEIHPPYERPPLSKDLLSGKTPVEKTYLLPLKYYAEAEITLEVGATATAIDARAQRVDLADGRNIPYDALMLTTGARARRLSLPGGAGKRVLYLRDIEDALALRAQIKPGLRLAVIGAGFIGLEVAATARRAGAEVTVVEYANHPLARVAPQEIGEFVAGLHRRNGVVLQTGTAVTGMEDTGHSILLRTKAGETFEADLVVVGIGAVPNLELAVAAGLKVDDGILVDEYGRTSDSNIFAAGDVTRHFNPLIGRTIRLESWQNAQNQATAVAKIMSGGNERFSEVPWFWTDQFDMNLQMAGAPNGWDQLVWRGAPDDSSFTLFHLAQGKPVAATTVNNARDMRFARMLIARGQPADPATLADKANKLQDLCR